MGAEGPQTRMGSGAFWSQSRAPCTYYCGKYKNDREEGEHTAPSSGDCANGCTTRERHRLHRVTSPPCKPGLQGEAPVRLFLLLPSHPNRMKQRRTALPGLPCGFSRPCFPLRAACGNAPMRGGQTCVQAHTHTHSFSHTQSHAHHLLLQALTSTFPSHATSCNRRGWCQLWSKQPGPGSHL